MEDKVVITEKAMVRTRNEWKATIENMSSGIAH